MNSNVETEFNLDETVQKWNEALTKEASLATEEVISLARDSIRLVTHLHGISIQDLEKEGGEEVSWGYTSGHIGLDSGGEPWIEIDYRLVNLQTLLNQGGEPKEISDFFWKGLLLKHRGNPLLHPYADSINSLLQPVVR